MRVWLIGLFMSIAAVSPAASQQIKYVEQNLNHHGQGDIRDYKMSCPDNYTPIGVKLISNRLLGHFKDVPSGRTATLEFFDWAGGGSQASTIITLICSEN
ncbi:hypothetical protein OIU34_16900 [Pararhizobium sp. BT-229]|uniref:hypothetical protein n=1 Tax=Pararhizobium sp. BT-229 TaxID=2986923 RepID=UPI0021F6AAD1|nr:hypothetical protein [Pararhizobium sp. BT-229]MCV9963584.1 hypothetical protein [Pararhizobium sp. BT-229]